MTHARLLSTVVVLAIHSYVFGQQPAQTTQPAQSLPAGRVPAAPLDVKKATAVPAQPGTPAEPPKENQRLQKLQQLQFDRRPSAILKGWATFHKPAEKDESKPEPEKKDPIDEELAEFRRDVTLGNWGAVQAYLMGLPEEEGKTAYRQLLQSLQSGSRGGPMPVPQPGVGVDEGEMERMMMMMEMGMPVRMGQSGPMNLQQFAEQNVFSVNDMLGLAAASPRALDKDTVARLGGILQRALSSTAAIEHAVVRFKEESARPDDKAVLTRRQVAQLLLAAGQVTYIGDFLPTLEKARTDNDHEALNLLARVALALHAKEKKVTHLEQAWNVTQSILAAKGTSQTNLDEALKRAVELAPKIREELGQTWLDESFTKDAQRGMDILATVGGVVAQGLQTQPMNSQFRHKELELQKAATEALLKAAPERATAWRETLTLLAGNWLREAEHSRLYDRSSGLGPRMQRDRFGNIYYLNLDEPMPNYMQMQQPNVPQAIRTGDLLDVRPGEKWHSFIDDGMKPQLAMVTAQLYLKVNEEEKAFPYIEQLAMSHPEKAKALVSEFIRVWTKNHDPNEARKHTNPYMYMYGFEMRAQSIPLTRSKQERNLVDLSKWIKRLRALPGSELDEELLAKAFTACHSSAEVYRIETIEIVFGSVTGLKPKTLAGLAQQMRENLGGIWRQPAEQKKQQTNRKQKDIEAEVMRGYAVARATVENALQKLPNEWALQLAKAALLHDETNYRQQVAKGSDFSHKRLEALASFQKAAQLYAKAAVNLTEDEETTKVYEQWFYASLGACDLQHLDEEKLPDLRQAELIRTAIRSLPGELAERHMSKFANLLFTRMSVVKPAAKERYVRAGFEIVGDHKQAWEARKVYDYYKDLVSELKLEALIDGSDRIGHGKPFGVRVNLRHTREIERESGGFGRYLQNQNQYGYFFYNYGRPNADYRDKFQTAVTEAVKEHFEVMSVTFQTEKVNAIAAEPHGWRITPYAYLLLKAKGPQVDKLPTLRMDLDFLDTSGYVILPISSPAIPVDTAHASPRPLQKLQITQILDERQAKQGKLIVEVKSSGRGLIGGIDEILDLRPDGFEVTETNDQGLSVAKFDENEPQEIVSERNWLVTLKAKDAAEAPRSFRFGKAKADPTEMVYQRYVDADLATVAEEVSLEQRYAGRDWRWAWWLAAGVLGLVLIVLIALRLRKSRSVDEDKLDLPDHITPFTVTGLLYRIQRSSHLNETERAELQQAIDKLEQHYFAEGANRNGEINLRQVAETWVRHAK